MMVRTATHLWGTGSPPSSSRSWGSRQDELGRWEPQTAFPVGVGYWFMFMLTMVLNMIDAVDADHVEPCDPRELLEKRWWADARCSPPRCGTAASDIDGNVCYCGDIRAIADNNDDVENVDDDDNDWHCLAKRFERFLVLKVQNIVWDGFSYI